jgi:hypothetical protein
MPEYKQTRPRACPPWVETCLHELSCLTHDVARATRPGSVRIGYLVLVFWARVVIPLPLPRRGKVTGPPCLHTERGIDTHTPRPSQRRQLKRPEQRIHARCGARRGHRAGAGCASRAFIFAPVKWHALASSGQDRTASFTCCYGKMEAGRAACSSTVWRLPGGCGGLAWWKGVGRAYGAAAKRLAGPRGLRRLRRRKRRVPREGDDLVVVGDCEGLAGSFMARCEELGEARRMGALGSCEGIVGDDGGEGKGSSFHLK